MFRFRQWQNRAPMLVVSGALLAVPASAHAGMTVYTLTDIVRARLDVISFFLAAALVLALVFQRCWNALSAEFAKMPALSFRRSLAVIFVASLFCGLILTMISGARELMTPGAWEKVGTTYRLPTPQRDPQLWLESVRRRAIEQLRDALWNHAQVHDGLLPSERFAADIPSSLWRAPDPDATPFGYLPRQEWGHGVFGFRAGGPSNVGRSAPLKGDPRAFVLLYEPSPFGNERYVVVSTGEVLKLKANELEGRVKQELPHPPKGGGAAATDPAR